MKEVLYRKYRPQTFEEVVGQKHIARVLEAALQKNRISHAYLFSGPRGTGKTTVARIFARAINCAELARVQGAGLPTRALRTETQSGSGAGLPVPCNQCETCREFLSGSTLDVNEIDAASARGIDEIRALREAVLVLPFKARYKVYIIDEVHMLTKEAFNALLKTLEEPPEHAVFILATTEPDKVLETVVSRTQHFEFRRIPEEELEAALERISKKEEVRVEREALGIIALMAEGSLRDAQNILDQGLAYRMPEELRASDLRGMFGLPSAETLAVLSTALFERDARGALQIIHDAVRENFDSRAFFKLLIRDFRFLLYLKLDPSQREVFQKFLSARELDSLAHAAEKYQLQRIEEILGVLHQTYPLLKIAYLPQLPLELAILKITTR